MSEVDELRAEVAALKELVEQLRAENAELRARLGSNSTNSSKPPSSDGYAKPTRQQRRDAERATRKVGGQPGSRGHHLARVDRPDEVIHHEPQCCAGCGGSLEGADLVDEEVRQVFDIPPQRIVVREHRARRWRCLCGKSTKAVFPSEAIGVTCYGPQVRALAVYLVCGHFLPFERSALVLSDICGLGVSPGSVVNMVEGAAVGLTEFAVAVREALRNQGVVHFDETGARAAGRLFWVHSASTETLTAFLVHANRGIRAIDEMGLLALGYGNGGTVWTFDGVAVHDGWRAYRSYEVVHALCNAHHLRELEAVTELGQIWAADMALLLRTAKQLVDESKARGEDSLAATTHHLVIDLYDQLIRAGLRANPEEAGRKQTKARNLLTRLSDHRDDVLRFTQDFAVPFDNNQAERDIRMVKLQQKVSGCWRSLTGATNFLQVREYLSTARKQGHGALDVLIDLFTGNCWMPGAARV